MFYLVMTLHLVISLLLCVVVLLQSSKGDGLAGAFGGGGGGQAVFGARGVTTVLHKATIYLAIGFMTTSVVLVFLTMQRAGGSSSSLSRQAAERVVPVSSTDMGALGTGDDAVVPAADEPVPTDQVVPPAPPEGTTGEQENEQENTQGGGESGGGGEQ